MCVNESGFAIITCHVLIYEVTTNSQILFGSIFRATPRETCSVISHGITIRAFVMMWCRYSPEWFQGCRNPPNCSIRLLDHSSPEVDQGYIIGGFDQLGPCESISLLTWDSTHFAHIWHLRDAGKPVEAPPPKAVDTEKVEYFMDRFGESLKELRQKTNLFDRGHIQTTQVAKSKSSKVQKRK